MPIILTLLACLNPVYERDEYIGFADFFKWCVFCGRISTRTFFNACYNHHYNVSSFQVIRPQDSLTWVIDMRLVLMLHLRQISPGNELGLELWAANLLALAFFFFGPFVTPKELFKISRLDPPFPTDLVPWQQTLTYQPVHGVGCRVEPPCYFTYGQHSGLLQSR